jgi:hypothetical protein
VRAMYLLPFVKAWRRIQARSRALADAAAPHLPPAE